MIVSRYGANSRGDSSLSALSTADVGATTGESEEDEARGLDRRPACRGRSGQAAGTRRNDWDGEREKAALRSLSLRPGTRWTSDPSILAAEEGSLWLRRVCGAKSRGSWRSLAGMALPGVCAGSDDDGTVVGPSEARRAHGWGPGLLSGLLRLCLATGGSPTVVDCAESPGMTGSPTNSIPLDRPRRQRKRYP